MSERRQRHARHVGSVQRLKRNILSVVQAPEAVPGSAPKSKKEAMVINPRAVDASRRKGTPGVDFARVMEPFKPYEPPPGVLPDGKTAKMAMDSSLVNWAQNDYAASWGVANPAAWAFAEGVTFLGYSYLAELTQRPEYRKISERIATEMTRKWIRLTVAGDDSDEKIDREAQKKQQTKLKELAEDMKTFGVRDVFRRCAEQDGWFGRSHIYIDTGDTNDRDELQKSIGNGADAISLGKFEGKKNFLKGFRNVEPIWCYPAYYNAIDPLADDWYRPQIWFAQAKQVHVTRLLTFVGREVPDILKPAYAFGGLSMSQMAKPYVDNWLRTRQAVTDLVESFSVSGIYTNMSSILSGAGGDDVFERIDIFNNTRSNRGAMALDKDTEEFFNISTPLGSLDKLQAQAQEQMASVSGIPLIVLLGITPTGLNASSEGELRVFYDFIHAFAEMFFRPHLHTVINFLQLNRYGEIDPAIGFEFEPLWSLDEKGLAEVEKLEAETDVIYADAGVISPAEVREAVIANPNSRYAGLDPDDVPDLEEEEDDGFDPEAGPTVPGKSKRGGDDGEGGGSAQDETPFAEDAEFEESKHPRADNGQFGRGGGSAKPAKTATPAKTAPSSGKHEPAPHPVEKMRDYSPKELDWEYDVEYLKYSKPAFPNAFSSREDFEQKLDAAPLVHLSDEQMRTLGNSMAYQAKNKGEAWLHKTFSHRRDSKRIVDTLKNGETAPPIVLKSGNKLHLMAGQTRLAAGLAIGKQVPAKVIDVTPKRAQDEAPWDESKHPRAPDGKFGTGSGGGTASASSKEGGAGSFKSKKEHIAHLLKMGTTTKEILQATGWPTVSVPAQAAALGFKLEKSKVDGETVYVGKPMTDEEKAQLKQLTAIAKAAKKKAGPNATTAAIAEQALKDNPALAAAVGKSKAAAPAPTAEPAPAPSEGTPSAKAEAKFKENTAGKKLTEHESAKEKIKAVAQTDGDLATAEKLLTPAEKKTLENGYYKSVQGNLDASKKFIEQVKTQEKAAAAEKAKAEAAAKAAAEEAKKFEESLNSPEAKEHYAALEGILSGSAKSAIKNATTRLKAAGLEGKMTPIEAAQVIAYSGSSYREVNQQLRAGVMTEKQYMFAEALNSALSKMPNHVGVTRRGTTLSPQQLAQYKPGMIVNEAGFMSSSKSNPFGGNTHFEIHGKTGKDIQKLSNYHGEAEVLFRAGTKFRVKEKTGNKIVLEEMTFGRTEKV